MGKLSVLHCVFFPPCIAAQALSVLSGQDRASTTQITPYQFNAPMLSLHHCFNAYNK
jgi:hypothetical protein